MYYRKANDTIVHLCQCCIDVSDEAGGDAGALLRSAPAVGHELSTAPAQLGQAHLT